jgi:hypothetical protein
VGEVYILHPLSACTKELLKSGNMLRVIAYEHSIKRGFIYMVQNHGNKRILMGTVTRTMGGTR